MSLTSYSPSVLSDNYLKVKIEKYIETFKSISQKENICIIFGCGYFDDNNYLFNRAYIVLPNNLLYYDKINITEVEARYFKNGNKPICFNFRGKTIGVMICRDQNYPELASELSNKGSEVIYILAAHYYNPKEARWKIEKNRAIPITRAVENKCIVALSNTVGTHLNMISLGNSLIVEPDGNVVVGANECEEVMLTYEFK